jgi:hypothetical protein
LKFSNINKTQNEMLPRTAKYFKEELISHIEVLNRGNPDIESLVDYIATAEIINYTLKEDYKAMSIEGQRMSGKKLIIEVLFKNRLSYDSTEIKYGINIVFSSFIKSIFIVVPEKIGNDYVCDLIRAQKFMITPYIEEVHSRKLDDRRIHIASILFVDLKFC